MVSLQIRSPLTNTLQQHANRAAGSLLARQFKAISASASILEDFPQFDTFLCDTTAGSITMTLPTGSDAIIGLPIWFYKTVAGNTLTVQRLSGSGNTIEGATSVATTGVNTVIGLVWDGTTYRRLNASVAAGTGLLAANNLSDLAAAATARTNLGSTTVGDAVFIAATAAAARTALGVSATTASDLKADVHPFLLPRVDLIGANAWQIRFRMGFAGTFTRISSVTSGAALDANAVGTLLIAGGAVTGGVVTHANLAAAGDAIDQAITAGGAFTEDQEIRYTVSGTNAAAAFAGVMLEHTRA